MSVDISQKQVNLHVYRALHNLASDSKFTPFVDILREVAHTMHVTKDADDLAQGIFKSLKNFIRLHVIVERNETYSLYNDSLRRRHMSTGSYTPEDTLEDASEDTTNTPAKDEAPKRPHEEDKPSSSKNAKAKNKAKKQKISRKSKPRSVNKGKRAAAKPSPKDTEEVIFTDDELDIEN
ncbi:hypothetical protein KR074_007196 [Drosophila pseudoananassae]|nr:hypothetical protein KR074_007196 [Drosophila pseudoananassae]